MLVVLAQVTRALPTADGAVLVLPDEPYFPKPLSMADPAGGTCSPESPGPAAPGDIPHVRRGGGRAPRLLNGLRASNLGRPHKFAPDCLGPLLAIADAVIFED